MRRAGRWVLIALFACGGGDRAEQAVDQSSSTADDGGAPAADGALDADLPRGDARTARPGEPADASAREDAGAAPPPAPVAAPCDPLRQAGCAPGEQCDATGGAFRCVPAGALGPFRRCDAPGAAGACGAGSTCLATPYDDARCAPYCDLTTGSGCPGNGQTCVPLPRVVEAVGACQSVHQCSPIGQDCAAPDQSCVWTPLGAFCVWPSDFVANGGACDSAASCETGSTCVDDGSGTTRCFRQCDPAAQGADCAADERCERFAEVWPGEVGACRFAGSVTVLQRSW